MKDAQKQVDEWAKQHDPPYWQPLEQFTRLVEEVGELARELNHHFGPKKKKSSEPTKELSEEMGDVLFTIICLANALDIDLEKSFKQAMDKCYGRDKNRYKKK